MKTPFMRVTIGSYLDRLPGVITNVNISWDKDYPFEINLDGPEGGSLGTFVLPHILNVSVTYKPIHDFLPRKSIDSPFIIPSSNSGIVGNNDFLKSWTTDNIQPDINAAVNTLNS